MANCTNCNEKIGFFSNASGGMCEECGLRYAKSQSGTDFKNRTNSAEKRQAVEAILLTTETAPNLNITKRIEIVSAECAFGMNIFKDLFAGVRDIVGGRSEAVQKTMRDSRKTALYELKKEAYEVGANAVVGVDLDYVELSNAGSMVMLVASGTAVRIEE
ncbi:MAG: heavy metal-binding domain-containing protein [Paracoccaceae bacterium]|nr:heavy metal-binding domain-containing protein [Paracoccaceae bacterium]MDG2259551.1 heavy metal-binding domain-containing protein [Paracoccaceae bacterium]